MMSFMRHDNEQDVTSTDGSENISDVGQEDYLLPSNNIKSVKRNTMVLAVFFAVGVLSLFFMIKKVGSSTVNAAISDDALQIESAVANLSGIKTKMGGKLSEVLNKIASLSDIEQVEVDQLQKNPFRHSSVINFDMGNKSRSYSGQGAANKADSLRLWTIMSSGKGRSCMINNELLYEGDSISGLRVSRIGDDFVELSAHGARVFLRMSK